VENTARFLSSRNTRTVVQQLLHLGAAHNKTGSTKKGRDGGRGKNGETGEVKNGGKFKTTGR